MSVQGNVLFTMVLRVKFEDFAEAWERYAKGTPVYVQPMEGGSGATAVNLDHDLILSAVCTLGPNELRSRLEKAGMKVAEGAWTSDEEEGLTGVAASWVAAVAYRSHGAAPGLWVDVFPHAPTSGDVIRRWYEEFVAQGEVKSVTLDEFVRLAQPTVVVLDPDEQRHFLERH